MTASRLATDVWSILVRIEYFIEHFFVFFVVVDIFVDVVDIVDLVNVADLVDVLNVAVVDKAFEWKFFTNSSSQVNDEVRKSDSIQFVVTSKKFGIGFFNQWTPKA